MKISILIGILTIFTATAHSAKTNELSAFTSDGCSTVPDGTIDNPTLWQKCCVIHDVWYWLGGTQADRALADRGLYQCILDKTHDKNLATTYWNGVRVGGAPFSITTYRWGYGWKKNRAYQAVPTELTILRDSTLQKITSENNFDYLIAP